MQRVIAARYCGEQPVGTTLLVRTHHPAIRWVAHMPTMRVPEDVADSLNAYLAFRSLLTEIEWHNRGGGEDVTIIRSVICAPCCTSSGCMRASKSARQMRAAWDSVFVERPPVTDWPALHRGHKTFKKSLIKISGFFLPAQSRAGRSCPRPHPLRMKSRKLHIFFPKDARARAIVSSICRIDLTALRRERASAAPTTSAAAVFFSALGRASAAPTTSAAAAFFQRWEGRACAGRRRRSGRKSPSQASSSYVNAFWRPDQFLAWDVGLFGSSGGVGASQGRCNQYL